MAPTDTYVGIDLSKTHLDLAVHATGEPWRVLYDADGIKQVVTQLTSQATAVFERINESRMPIGVGRGEPQSERLSDVRALGPRLREDDGQRSWSLLNARKRTVRHKSAE